MELYHHLIDTDSLSARILALTQDLMPKGTYDDTAEAVGEAVDAAIDPILKVELKQVMDKVEATVRSTVRARLSFHQKSAAETQA